ncbi:MAG: methyltransferase domain-containing protein [Acidobacteriota bacterium]|nr:methyltransferase domain-containing protein [Acidobacteriota bacterium]
MKAGIGPLMPLPSEKLLQVLRCPSCHRQLSLDETDLVGTRTPTFSCDQCREEFPLKGGIPRLLLLPLREALLGKGIVRDAEALQVETALSFGFEWNLFPEMYREWERSFQDYMEPHNPGFFRGKKVLDAGCGNGRFAFHAARCGAEVWAIDLGPAVEVARRNCESEKNVQVVQADLHNPPFDLESFDFIYSIGVLHHLPEPETAFQNLIRFLKPGGEIQIYLYWKPERQPIKRAMLAVISWVRSVTTRLPHTVVHALSYPSAMAAFALFVWPYQLMRVTPGLEQLAEKIPMRQYAAFPFRVCVNDQLDRLSAPIENRYTREEVFDWLKRAGLEDPQVLPNFGWLGTGRKPGAGSSF